MVKRHSLSFCIRCVTCNFDFFEGTLIMSYVDFRLSSTDWLKSYSCDFREICRIFFSMIFRAHFIFCQTGYSFHGLPLFNFLSLFLELTFSLPIKSFPSFWAFSGATLLPLYSHSCLFRLYCALLLAKVRSQVRQIFACVQVWLRIFLRS